MISIPDHKQRDQVYPYGGLKPGLDLSDSPGKETCPPPLPEYPFKKVFGLFIELKRIVLK